MRGTSDNGRRRATGLCTSDATWVRCSFVVNSPKRSPWTERCPRSLRRPARHFSRVACVSRRPPSLVDVSTRRRPPWPGSDQGRFPTRARILPTSHAHLHRPRPHSPRDLANDQPRMALAITMTSAGVLGEGRRPTTRSRTYSRARLPDPSASVSTSSAGHCSRWTCEQQFDDRRVVPPPTRRMCAGGGGKVRGSATGRPVAWSMS